MATDRKHATLDILVDVCISSDVQVPSYLSPIPVDFIRHMGLWEKKNLYICNTTTNTIHELGRMS